MTYAEQFNRNRVEYLYQLARHPGLKPVDVRVGLLFATFVQAESREELAPTYEWLMKAAHIKGRATLAGSIARLEKAGMLEVGRGLRTRSLYALPFDGNGPWEPQFKN